MAQVRVSRDFAPGNCASHQIACAGNLSNVNSRISNCAKPCNCGSQISGSQLRRFLLWIFVIAPAVASQQACNVLEGPRVNREQSQRVHAVRKGTVSSVRDVWIEPSQVVKATGTAVGASLGALAGAGIGDGRTRAAWVIVGTTAGAIGGNVAASTVGAERGLQLTISLDSGNQVSIVQPASYGKFAPGDRVDISGDYGAEIAYPPQR